MKISQSHRGRKNSPSSRRRETLHHLRPNGADPSVSPHRRPCSSPTAASATLHPSIKRFLTKECNYMEVVSRTPLIHGIFVALALRIAVPRGSKNCFFNCTILRHTVGLTVIIIISWFRAAQGGQPALLCVARGVIGFVAAHCLLNKVKQDGINQLMGKVWDWNMYGTKLKKFDGWALHTANNDGDRRKDDATALPADRGDGPEDHDGHQNDRSAASEDSDDEPWGRRLVQLLAIRANFPIHAIHGHDWCQNMKHEHLLSAGGGSTRGIYWLPYEGMVDLVPTGPASALMSQGDLALRVFCYTTSDEGSSMVGSPIIGHWDVSYDDKISEYTQTICAGHGRKLEVTYLVIPRAVETDAEVWLKLKDVVGSSSRAVHGKIKASSTSYGNKWVHLFSRERGRSLSFLSGSASILPLSPSVIALPYSQQLELHIEVDLTLITTCDSQEEEVKNLKFSLEFTREIRSQEREVDGDQVQVNIIYDPYEV
ncbi:hypothetical protein EJB05_26463, partial [Eragrostis curvula]